MSGHTINKKKKTKTKKKPNKLGKDKKGKKKIDAILLGRLR